MTPPMTDVAAICAALSLNHRSVLLALDGEWQPAPRSVSRQRVAHCAMQHPSLVEREWQDGCAQCTYYRLTPLGLAVRSALMKDKAL